MAAGASRVLTLTYVGNTSKLDKSNKEAESGIAKLGSKFKTFGKVAGTGVLAVGVSVAAAAKGIFRAAESVAGANDKILKSSLKVGAASDKYQELQYWAGQNGVESDNLTRALGRLNQRIAKADDETKGYGKAFANLGVAVRDTNGELRTSDAVFNDTIASLRAIESPAERSAKAAEVFGTKLARDLMPALADTSLSIDEAAQKARDLGLVMDEDALEASARFGDALADVRGSLESLKNRALAPVIEFFADVVLPMIVDKVIPTLLILAERIGPHLQKFIARTVVVFQALVVFTRDRLVPIFLDLTRRVQGFIDTIREWWQRVSPGVIDAFQKVTDRVRDFVAAVREWWERVSPGVIEAFKTLREPIQNLFSAFRDTFNAVRDLFGALAEVFGQFRTGEREGSGFERFIRVLVASVERVVVVMTFMQRATQKVIEALQKLVESRWFSATIEGLARIIELYNRARGLSEKPIPPPPVEAPRPAPAPPSGPAPRGGTGGAQTVSLTVNTGIGDPSAIAREVERVLRNETNRSGPQSSVFGQFASV